MKILKMKFNEKKAIFSNSLNLFISHTVLFYSERCCSFGNINELDDFKSFF